MVSIIIRTKNEERWITQCLKGVFEQAGVDFEVIIVDNRSKDKTLSKAGEFPVKIVEIEDYLPGKALNAGIRASRGEYICCLSGHCIPVNDQWLSSLLDNFADDPGIAGVYGRQEPMSFTSDLDRRDLLNIFGLDKKVQVKDSFFHNASSMIRRDIWQKYNFDEKITNIEDRVWATQVIKDGYKLIYEPRSRVYHYHGIHQDNDMTRCSNVVRILEGLKLDHKKGLDIDKLNVVALIPIRGPVQYLKDKPVLSYTIDSCKRSKFIKRVIVSTDNPEAARIAEESGAEVPFLRSKELSGEHIELEKVLQFSVEQIEKQKIFADVFIILEATYPFRKHGLCDSMISRLVENGLDSVIPVRKEYKSCWTRCGDDFKRIDSGFVPRSLKEPLYIGLAGVGCVTYPVFIREGKRLGDKIGIFELDDPYSWIEVRSESDLKLAQGLIDDWRRDNK